MKNSCFWRFLNTIRQQEWLSFEEKNPRKNTSRGKNLVTLRQMVACKAKKKARKICFQTKALDQEKHFFLPFSVYLPLAVKWSDTKNHPA